MKLLVDENLPPRLARSLQALFEGEHVIIALRDKFSKSGVSDLEWISTLKEERGWSVLSADQNIGKNKIERNAFLEANLVGFFLAPSLRKRPLTVQMSRILYLWDAIDQQTKIVNNGIFRIGPKGNKFDKF